ncbi:MAG: HD domain-containing protein [Schleiferiaceae bacterium]
MEAPLFATIGQAADELGLETYVIGGYVRDQFLERPLKKDIDVVAVGNGIELAKAVARKLPKKVKVSVFKNFGTAHFNYKGTDYEFVGARTESYSKDSRKPVVAAGTLEDDQNRRDFTINALALSLNSENFGDLLDPFNGLEDLKAGRIVTPLDPDITFSDDPLRMMRAIRFANQLAFNIDPVTLKAISAQAQRIKIISRERIADELNKIMMCQKPSVGLNLLFTTGLLHHFMPELVALQGVEEVEGQLHKDNFFHTLEVVDNISRTTENVWLRYAALFHDIGKPVTKKFEPDTGWTFHAHEFVGSKMVPRIFRSMKMPLNEKMKYVQKIVRLSSRPIALVNDVVTDSAVRRLLFDAGPDAEDLMLLCDADVTTKNPKRKRKYLKNFQEVRVKMKEVEEKDKVRNWQPPISGETIMETFGLKPCKEVGEIKTAIREAILEGDIKNDTDEAYAFMLKKGEEYGLTQVIKK